MDEFVGGLFMSLPDIVLRPLYISQIMKVMLGLRDAGIDFTHTNAIAYLEMATLVSRIQPESTTMFVYFSCFSSTVWLLIFLSIAVCSLVLAMKIDATWSNNFLKIFILFFWNLWLLLFNRSLQSFVKRNISRHKILVGTWLLSSLYISTLFTTFLLDYMIRASPIRKIDSLEDAVMATDLTILCSDESSLVGYVESEGEDPIARALSQKIQNFPDGSWLNMSFTVDMLAKLKSGFYALAHNKLTAIFLIHWLSELEDNRRSNEDILDVIHVASDGGGGLPTFLSVNQESLAFSPRDFNRM